MGLGHVRLQDEDRVPELRGPFLDASLFCWAWHPDAVPGLGLVVDLDAVGAVVDNPEGAVTFLQGSKGGNP